MHDPDIQVVQLAGQLSHVFVLGFRKVDTLHEQLFVEVCLLYSSKVESHVEIIPLKSVQVAAFNGQD